MQSSMVGGLNERVSASLCGCPKFVVWNRDRWLAGTAADSALDEWSSDQAPLTPEELVGYGPPPEPEFLEQAVDEETKENQQRVR